MFTYIYIYIYCISCLLVAAHILHQKEPRNGSYNIVIVSLRKIVFYIYLFYVIV